MEFKTPIIIKHHIDSVWTTMRDELPHVTSKREDIHSVVEQERHMSSFGYKIVNIWTAKTKLPPAVVNFLGADKFVWTDRAEWCDESKICKWFIELHSFNDLIQCSGTTAFTSALGKTGTKITFSGKLDLKSGVISKAILSSIEPFVRNAIQKNFRKIAEAVGDHLNTYKKTLKHDLE